MAERFLWLSKLKGSQLKFLATRIGTNSSGTKAVLIKDIQARILNDVHNQESNNGGKRSGAKPTSRGSIISVDMGVKNLAYCQLLPTSNRSDAKPILAQWKRLDVFKRDDDGRALPVKDEENSQLKVAYEPSIFASAAHRIASTFVQLDPAAHIFIERQRFRSMGAASVLEWTIKVNMLEGMLYAVLATLSEEVKWEGIVEGVRPERVSTFWLGQGSSRDAVGGRRSKDVKMQKKKDTISMVQRWLTERGVRTKDQGAETAEKYLTRLRERGRRDDFDKLDDLADCLAQGMAIMKWRENSRICWEKGEEALAALEKEV